jgi:hypothetical protein
LAQGGFEVFDSDMHVLEPADLCERYIEAPFTHRAPLGSTHTPIGAAAEGAGPGPSLDPDSQRWARDVPLMTSAAGTIGLAAAFQVIACSASRYITATERRRALQGRANAGADGARPGSFVVLYRPTQPANAVQVISS